MPAPVFTKPLKDLTAQEGECMVLECRLTNDPSTKVVWFREGDQIEDSPDFRILHKGEISTLVIGSAYPEDSGTFECVAFNNTGSASTTCKLVVTGGGYYSVSTKSPSATTKIIPKRPRVVIAAGDTSEQIDANHNFEREKDSLVKDLSDKLQTNDVLPKGEGPDPERDYIRSPLPVAAERYYEDPNLPQEYRVSPFEQRIINEVEYRLERTPPVNEDPQDAIFENIAPGEQKSPYFRNGVGNFKLNEGAPMKFICRIAGSPKPKLYWFKDGKQISKRSQHYFQANEGDGAFSLTVPRTCMEDDGNYTALALNPKGRSTCTGRLMIINNTPQQFPMSAQDCRTITAPRMPEKGTLAEDEESPVDKYFRPVFIKKPSNLTGDEGKMVRLDVKVTGLPAPTLSWLINGRPVQQDFSHKILVRENNVHSLLIQPLSRMDEGQYSIVASNKAGEVTVHVHLSVIPQEKLSVPMFVERLNAQTVAEGASIRLQARVIGSPFPVINWKRGAEEILHTDRTQIFQDDSGYVCLLITEAHKWDSEWYTCSATNKAGIVSCRCKLDVYCPLSEAPTRQKRIRTPHRYANLAKVAGVDMREALSHDAQSSMMAHLPESEDL